MRYTNRDMIENGMLVPAPRMAKRNVGCHIKASDAERTAFKCTEKRLSQLGMVQRRLEDERSDYCELKELGVEALRSHDASFVSLISPGMRLDPMEAHAVQMQRLEKRISADGREIKKMRSALKDIENDPYYAVLELYYEHGMKDEAIGEKMGYDRSTIARHRSRLVRLLACRLYGV
jgi:DNA-binding MarR family transcriptional regulator